MEKENGIFLERKGLTYLPVEYLDKRYTNLNVQDNNL